MVALTNLTIGAAAITWGGNNQRQKIYTNSGVSPALLAKPSFGRRATVNLPLFTGPVDSIYAQPLVYSAPNGTEYVMVVSTGNNMHVIDGFAGTVVAQQNFGMPHYILQDPVFNPDPAEPECTDILNFVGTVGTPTIDMETGIAYFFSITANPPPAPFTRTMSFHAVDAFTLKEQPGFPVVVEATAANDPNLKFNANLHYQRPGTLLLNGVVYAAFGGHCDLHQGFLGWIIGFNATTGATVTAWSSMIGPDIKNGGGAFWQAGAGITLDDDMN
ncbi:hypothetical protein HK101_003561, partial [Irineochytrium annulatum]